MCDHENCEKRKKNQCDCGLSAGEVASDVVAEVVDTAITTNAIEVVGELAGGFLEGIGEILGGLFD